MMRYRRLQHGHLEPSAICLGAGSFGISVPEETSFDLLDRFVAAGGNFVDTALVYGEWLPNGKGRSEQTIGAWMAQRGNRHDIVVGTKGAHPRLDTMDVPRLSPNEIVGDLHESIRNLRTDYVDLYWLHRDDRSRPVGSILETLNEHVAAGTIRAFGCSNWRLDRIMEAQEYAATHNLQGFTGNQVWWSLAEPNPAASSDPTLVRMDEAMGHYHREHAFAAMAYTSQARGYFTKMAAGTASDGLRAAYDNAPNRARMTRLRQLSSETGASLSALALAFVVNQPFPAFPISGCSSVAQLNDNLRAGDLVLTPSQVAWLDRGEQEAA